VLLVAPAVLLPPVPEPPFPPLPPTPPLAPASEVFDGAFVSLEHENRASETTALPSKGIAKRMMVRDIVFSPKRGVTAAKAVERKRVLRSGQTLFTIRARSVNDARFDRQLAVGTRLHLATKRDTKRFERNSAALRATIPVRRDAVAG
jgi:hypothetical protein